MRATPIWAAPIWAAPCALARRGAAQLRLIDILVIAITSASMPSSYQRVT